LKNPGSKQNKAKKSEKRQKKPILAKNPINPIGEVGFQRRGDGLADFGTKNHCRAPRFQVNPKISMVGIKK
jgi:hypothetical protein